MTDRGIYNQHLSKRFTKAQMNEFADLTQILPMMELLKVNLTVDEAESILMMIGNRLQTVYGLFQYEINDHITRAKVKETFDYICYVWNAYRLCYEYPVITCDDSNNNYESVDKNDLIVDIAFRIPMGLYLSTIRITMDNVFCNLVDPYKGVILK